MHVVLEVQSGASAGRRIELDPGKAALVGRASWAELAVPDDPHISGRHFRIECKENSCLLLDQKNSAGTYLNGGKVDEALLRDGDRITAGQTTFSVRIQVGAAVAEREADVARREPERPEAAPVADAVPAAADASQKSTLKLFHLGDPLSEPEENRPYAPTMPIAPEASVRFSEQAGVTSSHPRGWLYAVVDGGKQRMLAWKAKLAGYDPVLLVPGAEAPALATKAPYFFAIPKGANFLEEWNATLGQQAGVLVDSPATPEALYDHLRGLLGGDTANFFRFHDPNVLRKHLPAAPPAELERFFGPVQRWIIETESGDAWEAFSRKGPQVVRVMLGKIELGKEKAS